MLLEWAFLEGQQVVGDYNRSGIAVSTETIAYPAPVISSGTLRFNSSSTGSGSDLIMPPNWKDNAQWITFQGLHFSSLSEAVHVTYSSGQDTFACAIDATEAEGQVGMVEDTRIVCRTATQEPSGNYFFTVSVGMQNSMAGADALIFPRIPEVTSVQGCPLAEDGEMLACNTAGGVLGA